MTTSELKLLILNLLNQPVAFKHLIALCVIAWAYKKNTQRYYKLRASQQP
jgi:hypothetical protein